MNNLPPARAEIGPAARATVAPVYGHAAFPMNHRPAYRRATFLQNKVRTGHDGPIASSKLAITARTGEPCPTSAVLFWG